MKLPRRDFLKGLLAAVVAPTALPDSAGEPVGGEAIEMPSPEGLGEFDTVASICGLRKPWQDKYEIVPRTLLQPQHTVLTFGDGESVTTRVAMGFTDTFNRRTRFDSDDWRDSFARSWFLYAVMWDHAGDDHVIAQARADIDGRFDTVLTLAAAFADGVPEALGTLVWSPVPCTSFQTGPAYVQAVDIQNLAGKIREAIDREVNPIPTWRLA